MKRKPIVSKPAKKTRKKVTKKTAKAAPKKAVKKITPKHSGFSLYGRSNQNIKAAGLYNCRLNDITAEKGASIKPGDIVRGKYGFVISGKGIRGVAGNIVRKFKKTGSFPAFESQNVGELDIKAGQMLDVMHIETDLSGCEGVHTYCIVRIKSKGKVKYYNGEFARKHPFHGDIKLAVA